MKFRTILRCPVCLCYLDTITHDSPTLNPISASLLGTEPRRIHGKESPRCKADERWYLGWIEDGPKVAFEPERCYMPLEQITDPENQQEKPNA